jgi:murein DD-endopeptidase MepM/ murein hydrolase activator NlpD
MRRRRPICYPLTFLTVAVGIMAPAVAAADDGVDPAAPVEGAVVSPPSTAPRPPSTDEHESPSTPPTTEAAPPVTTDRPAEPRPPAAVADEAGAPAPEATALPADEPTAPPSTPPSTEIPVVSVDRPAESAPLGGGDLDVADELDADVAAELPDAHIVRQIAFPVLGPVEYANGWGNCRDGCTRRHVGTDMLGVRMQPLLAAVDGTVTRIRYENNEMSGGGISVTGADGWYYNYFHVNNDTPGTDDGQASHHWQVAPGLTVGSTVRAGQVIGYMGDSGNAEGSVPHLHFEIRQADHTPVNPYYSLVAAQQRERCDVSGGLVLTDPADLSPAAIEVAPIDGAGHWWIDPDGRLSADGAAARVAGAEAGCAETPAAVEEPAPVATAAPDQGAAEVPTAAPAGASQGAPTSEPAQPDLLPPTTVATEPESPAPADRPESAWTVARGDSLWKIAQEAYGVSDTAATASIVNLVFEHNRDVVRDPNVISIGMTLRLPPRS